MRRLLVLAAAVLAMLGATAAPAAAIDWPSIPTPSIGCTGKGDAPTPASPYGDGSWIVKLSTAEALVRGGHEVNGQQPAAADPFDDPGVSFESTYGTTPQWWTYDAGCVGGVFAGIGAGLGNIGLQLAGVLPNWSEALIDAVISPGSWIGALDQPVAQATDAIANGVWTPWLVVALLLVAGLVMVRARGGHLAGSINAATWALLVLVVVSWVIEYPTESVHVVDAGVRNAVVQVSNGFNEADRRAFADDCHPPQPCHSAPPTGEQTALQAVDQQMDAIVRSTQYRTWLAGVFGDADSSTAVKYGPPVFRATHFTWSEYDAYRKDPDGRGEQILESKQSSFKQLADKIKGEDPVAYGYFTGSHWGQRLGLVIMNGIVMAVVCGFLLMSGLAILFSFALIRLVVPFAPAAGILFMLDSVRDIGVVLLRKIVGPLVMGPVYFIVGLVLVRFEGQILTATGMWFVVKLALIGVLSWMAWRLTRPQAYGPRIPGLRAAAQLAATYVGSRAGTRSGMEDEVASLGAEPPYSRPRRARAEAVVTGVGASGVVHVPTAVGADVTARPYALQAGPLPEDEEYDELPTRGRPDRLTLPAPSGAVDDRTVPDDRPVLRAREVDEANLTYDEAGSPVFVLYTPDGDQSVPLEQLDPSSAESGPEASRHSRRMTGVA